MLQKQNDYIPQQRQSSGDFFTHESDPLPTRSISGIARIAGAKVEWTYEEPIVATDELPVLLSPGYCGIKAAYGELRHFMAEKGTPAVSYRPPRSQQGFGFLHPTHLRDVERLQAQAAYASMRDISRITGHEKYVVSGHSMGGRSAVRVAMEHPEYIDSLLLVGSAGLHGEHSLGEMMVRGAGVIRNEVIPGLPQLIENSNLSIGLDALYYIFRDPIRTTREGITVALCDSRKDIRKLRQYGIHIGALLFGNDGFFHEKDVMENSGDLMDVVRVLKDAQHIDPQLNPQQNATTQLEIIRDMHAQLPQVA